MNRFGISGLPYCIYSLAQSSDERKVTGIQDIVKDILYNNPAKTGIKASSSIDGKTLTVNATVQASSEGKYDLGMAIMKDNCKPSSSEANESVYNDVVIGITGNYFAMSTDAFQLSAGQEKEISRTWTSDALSSDCIIALFTLCENSGKVQIDNVVTFKAGSKLEYRLN